MKEALLNRSRSYYKALQNLPAQRKKIYSIILNHANGITAQSISRRYKIPINNVGPRITELRDLCFIKECKSERDLISGKSCTMYTAVIDSVELLELTNVRYSTLIDQKKALEQDYHYGLSQYTLKYIKNELKKITVQIESINAIQNIAA
jgi:hypothetical protein|tara:strand:+ start:210 stop:659 length:450 start_codon:yes stop_codon:yes gene_type:complete